MCVSAVGCTAAGEQPRTVGSNLERGVTDHARAIAEAGTPLAYLPFSGNETVQIYEQSGKRAGFLGYLDDPSSVFVDPAGDVYVADVFAGIVIFHAGKHKPYRILSDPPNYQFHEVAVDEAGNVFASAGVSIFVYAPSGKSPTETLTSPVGVEQLAFDSAGNLLVVGPTNNNIFELVEFPSGSSVPTVIRTLPGVATFCLDSNQNLVAEVLTNRKNKLTSTIEVFAPPYTGDPVATHSIKADLSGIAVSADNATLWGVSGGDPPTAEVYAYPSLDKVKTIIWRKGYTGAFRAVGLYPPSTP